MSSIKEWFGEILGGLKTTGKGMKITWQEIFEPTFTIEYPDVLKDIPDSERGLHEYDVERCIACDNCANACPVACIYIESEGKGKKATMTRFEIDYQKCLFCNLCVPPCPVDCIKMGKDFDLTGYTREDMIVPFHLGVRPIIDKTEKAMKDIEKRAAEAEKAAAKAAEAAAAPPPPTDAAPESGGDA
ncbi:MAG: 4Fe-4S binding protein [Planctomycetota bacterium]